jgi:UDP-N-acetyl-D-glucosamine dehydrogenase
VSIDLPRSLIRLRSPHLKEAIAARSATVAVVGLGYVGLPLMVALDRAGFGAVGVDADPNRVASLASGHSYVSDVGDAPLQALSLIHNRRCRRI